MKGKRTAPVHNLRVTSPTTGWLARALPPPGRRRWARPRIGVCFASPIWSLLCAAQLQGCAGAQRPPHNHHRMRANHRRIQKLPGFSSCARASLAARTALLRGRSLAGRLQYLSIFCGPLGVYSKFTTTVSRTPDVKTLSSQVHSVQIHTWSWSRQPPWVTVTGTVPA